MGLLHEAKVPHAAARSDYIQDVFETPDTPAVRVLNPAGTVCRVDEDFIGRIPRLSQKSHNATVCAETELPW